jgi:putative RecB family exonuclease
VHFYAFLCEQVLGKRPVRVQLLYLRTGEVIQAYPSEQSVQFLPRRTAAVYQAIERACAAGEFRPRPGPLCAHCAYQRWCPAFGGDPERAAVEAPAALLAPAAA